MRKEAKCGGWVGVRRRARVKLGLVSFGELLRVFVDGGVVGEGGRGLGRLTGRLASLLSEA